MALKDASAACLRPRGSCRGEEEVVPRKMQCEGQRVEPRPPDVGIHKPKGHILPQDAGRWCARFVGSHGGCHGRRMRKRRICDEEEGGKEAMLGWQCLPRKIQPGIIMRRGMFGTFHHGSHPF